MINKIAHDPIKQYPMYQVNLKYSFTTDLQNLLSRSKISLIFTICRHKVKVILQLNRTFQSKPSKSTVQASKDVGSPVLTRFQSRCRQSVQALLALRRLNVHPVFLFCLAEYIIVLVRIYFFSLSINLIFTTYKKRNVDLFQLFQKEL